MYHKAFNLLYKSSSGGFLQFLKGKKIFMKKSGIFGKRWLHLSPPVEFKPHYHCKYNS